MRHNKSQRIREIEEQKSREEQEQPRVLPMSAHPDVEDEVAADALHPSEAAIDSMSHDEKAGSEAGGPDRAPIISINGEDVEDSSDEPFDKAA